MIIEDRWSIHQNTQTFISGIKLSHIMAVEWENIQAKCVERHIQLTRPTPKSQSVKKSRNGASKPLKCQQITIEGH